jgi:hypothetical protein
MVTNRIGRNIGKDSARIIDIICAETGPLQSPPLSLSLSSRCFNLSRALNPDHAAMSAGSYSGDPLLGPLENQLPFLCYLNIDLTDACCLNHSYAFNLSRW